jgi:hypothetical protein
MKQLNYASYLKYATHWNKVYPEMTAQHASFQDWKRRRQSLRNTRAFANRYYNRNNS